MRGTETEHWLRVGAVVALSVATANLASAARCEAQPMNASRPQAGPATVVMSDSAEHVVVLFDHGVAEPGARCGPGAEALGWMDPEEGGWSLCVRATLPPMATTVTIVGSGSTCEARALRTVSLIGQHDREEARAFTAVEVVRCSDTYPMLGVLDGPARTVGASELQFERVPPEHRGLVALLERRAATAARGARIRRRGTARVALVDDVIVVRSSVRGWLFVARDADRWTWIDSNEGDALDSLVFAGERAFCLVSRPVIDDVVDLDRPRATTFE